VSSKSSILTAIAVATALAAPGCVGQLDETSPAVDAGPPGAPDAQVQTAARVAFEQNVAPMLTAARPKGACIICHQGPAACPSGGGSCFLGEDPLNHYGALIGALAVGTGTPIITDNVATIRFVQRGDHTGNAFCTGRIRISRQMVPGPG